MSTAFQFFETESLVLAFAGSWGSDGVFRLFKAPGNSWEHHPRGSRTWDYFHQKAYRNGRADPLSESAITALPPLPPLPVVTSIDPETELATTVMEITEGPLFEKVHAAPRRRLGVFYVLREDLYETRFGDGKFHDLGGAFFSADDADAWMKQDASEWVEHSLEQAELVIRKGSVVLERSGAFGTATTDQILKSLTNKLEGRRPRPGETA